MFFPDYLSEKWSSAFLEDNNMMPQIVDPMESDPH